jgi:hypothetical protein
MMTTARNSYIIAFSVFLLSACGGVNQDQINKASEYCESHGGIGVLSGTALPDPVEVVCKDGTKIDGTTDTGGG